MRKLNGGTVVPIPSGWKAVRGWQTTEPQSLNTTVPYTVPSGRALIVREDYSEALWSHDPFKLTTERRKGNLSEAKWVSKESDLVLCGWWALANTPAWHQGYQSFVMDGTMLVLAGDGEYLDDRYEVGGDEVRGL